MKFVYKVLSFILSISLSSCAMEAPEKNLSDELEKKCTVSPQISRKRASSAILEFMEFQNQLFEKVKEKRARQENALQRKIQKGEIIPYRIGVAAIDLDKIHLLAATVKKIFYSPNETVLATVDLLVGAEQERALITNPIVKTYMRTAEIPK